MELFMTGNLINSPGESFLRELGSKPEVTVAQEAPLCLYQKRWAPRMKGLLHMDAGESRIYTRQTENMRLPESTSLEMAQTLGVCAWVCTVVLM